MDSQTSKSLLWAGLGLTAALGARALLRQLRAFDFRDKVAFVTGGSRGLGLVLSRQFASEGARLVICARDEDELERAREDIAGRGAAVLSGRCDLTDPAQVGQFVRRVEDRWGRIDVLVNNAGIIQVGPYETMTLADYREAMDANFFSAVHTVLAVVPGMRRRRLGRIVNISSIGGKVPVPHLMPYCASKFAVAGFSECLRAELAPYGIVVTTVCPGLMRTGSPPNAFFKGRNEKEYAWFSIGDALPGFSMRAEQAARQIINACRHGDAELITTLPAKVATRVHGLFPGLTADVQTLVNRLLPAPGGIGTSRATGWESQSSASPSFATTLSDRATLRNNEVPELRS